MAQGLGVAVSCLRGEAEEGGDGAVCYGRCTRETDGGVKRSRGKHFHLPSNLESLQQHMRPAGPSQSTVLVPDPFSIPCIQ